MIFLRTVQFGLAIAIPVIAILMILGLWESAVWVGVGAVVVGVSGAVLAIITTEREKKGGKRWK